MQGQKDGRASSSGLQGEITVVALGVGDLWGGVLFLKQRETKKDEEGEKNCDYSESEQAEGKRPTVIVVEV